MKRNLFILFVTLAFAQIPDKRIVAEWEPSLGTMIRWPLGIPMELVYELAQDDILYVLVENTFQENSARNSFNLFNVNMTNVDFIFTETYSHWTRDHGPQFLIGENYWKVINQQFNGYPEESGCDENLAAQAENQVRESPFSIDLRGWEEDDDTNIDFANHMNWDIQNLSLYFTGGNFMTDGYSMGFSTQLMVNENGLSNSEFEQLVRDQLYLFDYHILDNPNVLSIQHIDCLAKLVGPETIIIKQVSESSPEYDCIEDFAQSFYDLNTFYGRPFEIHRIFCPVINGGTWEVNPVAAYTNSLILNNKVLVPQYSNIASTSDINALNVYRQVMPGYEVIGFYNDSTSPWYGEDALHCRAIGIFDPNMIHISHKSIRSEELINNSFIRIEAEVIDYGNFDSSSLTAILYWKYESENSPFNQIILNYESDNIYSNLFPSLNPNTNIEYFIEVTNIDGNSTSHPNAGWHTFNTINISLGDVNADQSINIQDIILTVNLILNNQYDMIADLNIDGLVNVVDIVQIVNIILN